MQRVICTDKRDEISIRLSVLITMLIGFSSNLFAYDFEVNGIYYNKNSDGTSVSVTYKDYNSGNYNSYSGIVNIPSTVTYDGVTFNVITIGSYVFYGCESLSNVTIPSSVTSIETLAFKGCISLNNLTIPNSVTFIGAITKKSRVRRMLWPFP